jgi:hypothetical protein
MDYCIAVFDNDFVVPLVMQYMDVPSLVALGSTSQHHLLLMTEEVKRRKDRFRQIQMTIHASVTSLRPIPASDVREALKLQDEARRLVDSGLGWLSSKTHVQDRLGIPGSSCSTCRRDKLFLAERLILKPHGVPDLCQTCPILPTHFYVSSSSLSKGSLVAGDGSEPCEEISEASVQEMQQLISHLWQTERLSYSRKHACQVLEQAVRRQSSTASCATSPYVCNLDFPLRIVEARHQHISCLYDMEEVRHQLVRRTATRMVAYKKSVEAFRVACRAYVHLQPLSLPFLLWILTEIDEEQERQGPDRKR